MKKWKKLRRHLRDDIRDALDRPSLLIAEVNLGRTGHPQGVSAITFPVTAMQRSLDLPAIGYEVRYVGAPEEDQA